MRKYLIDADNETIRLALRTGDHYIIQREFCYESHDDGAVERADCKAERVATSLAKLLCGLVKNKILTEDQAVELIDEW